MSFQKIKPTVPELQKLKKKKLFSEKGDKLLGLKREQIFIALNQTFNDFKTQQNKLNTMMTGTFDLLKRGFQHIGKTQLESIAHLNEKFISPAISLYFINKMNIDYPELKLKLKDKSMPSYSLTTTPITIDVIMKQMKRVLHQSIKVAELNSILYQLANDYKKISRRIKALEDIILPKLTIDIHEITQTLEDHSREEKIRMKKIKEFIEQKEQDDVND